MVKIKFNNSDVFYTVTNFDKLSEHVVSMNISVNNTSGFTTYIDDEKVGDFSDFNHIYRKLENITQFSNDGSEYTEPVTVIKATFDNDPPETVEVMLSTGQELTLTDPFEETVSGDCVNIIRAEDFDDYNTNYDGAMVHYIAKSEEQKEEEKHSKEISEQTYRLAQMFVEMGVNVDDFLDRVDAQLLYTSLMTDTLLPEGEE